MVHVILFLINLPDFTIAVLDGKERAFRVIVDRDFALG